MPTYEWGKMPTFKDKVQVDENTAFEKGEVVLLENFQYTPSGVFPHPLTNEEALNLALDAFRNKGGKIVYYKAIVEVGGEPPRPIVTFDKLVIYSDPLPAIAIILALLVALGVIVILAPVIWKLSGVSPAEVGGYLGGFSLPFFAVVLAVVVFFAVILPLITRGSGKSA
jgi:hypothetical protein